MTRDDIDVATLTAAQPAGSSVSRGGVIAAIGGVAAVALVGSPFAQAAGSALVTGPSTTAANTVQATGSLAAKVAPLTLKAVAGQQADLTDWTDSAGVAVAQLQANGIFRTRGSVDIIGQTTNGVSTAQPLVVFWNNADNTGDLRKWSMGLDTSNTPKNNDFFIGRVNPDRSVNDLIFLQEYAPNRVAIGLGFVPPPPSGVAISGWDNSDNVPAVILRVGINQTGEALKIIDSAGTRTAYIDANSNAYFPTLTTGAITNANPGPLSIAGVRISSPDPAAPNGLFLNARATNSGPDFQLRALESSFWGAFFMQVTNRDATRSFLSIRQDNGYVGIGNITDMLAPLDIDGSSIRIRQPFTPASASAGGYQGQISWDPSNLYVCTGPSTWMRAPLSTW